MQVKADIEGTILAHVNGGAIYLRAGDEVPEGVTIDSHFVEGQAAHESTRAAPSIHVGPQAHTQQR